MPSYRKKHLKNRAYKIKPKKPIFRKLWFLVLLLVVIMVGSAIYFSLFYPGIQIKNILISGNKKVASSDIENLVSDEVSSRIVSIGNFEIDSKSIIWVNFDMLRKAILDKFPTIENVKISKKFPQTLVFQISERIPMAAFCPSSVIVPVGGKAGCYLIDNSGIIFEPINSLQQDMMIIRQEGIREIYTGENVVSQATMDLINKVSNDLKDNFKINIKQALVATTARVDMTTDGNWEVYFSSDKDYDINLQLTKLNLLLANRVSANNLKDLRYIDLRYKDRAIICDESTCAK